MKTTTKRRTVQPRHAYTAAGVARARLEMAVEDAHRAQRTHERAVRARDEALELAALHHWADVAILAVRRARKSVLADAKETARGR